MLALVVIPAWGQGPVATVGQALHHDTSPPLRDMAIRTERFTGLSKEVPIMAKPDFGKDPSLAEPDGGIQFSLAPSLGPTPAPIVSASGLSDDANASVVGTRIVPPDTNGDVGLYGSGNRISIQYINLIWAVYDDTGSLIAGPFAGNSFWQGFGGFCQANNDGDPVVLYDDQAGRWFFSQFSINQGIQCVAVSTTSDPLGPYHRYAFTVTPGGNNDYPKLGVWDDGTSGSTGQSAYTFTLRDFGGAGGSFSVSAGVMERDAMLNGVAAQFVKFSNPCSGVDCIEGQLPPHLAGSPPPAGTCPTYWAAVDAAYDDSPYASDGYRNHTLCVDWSNIANSTYSEGNLVAAGSNFDRFLGNGFSDCISPVNGGEVLDCLAAFTMYRVQYRWLGSEASIVLNTTVDAGSDRAGIRWAESRSADGDSGWFLQQDGTYAPADGLDRWMGSIAQDQDGNIALGYSVTGGSLFPSVRYTSRTAGDAAGTMPGGEVSCHEGTGAQIASSNRWGDYSSMSVDPVDDCTFWYTQEYYENTDSFDFKTRICSFKFADCGAGCSITEDPEQTCDDGVDNDCDGQVDCNDANCSSDPACVTNPCGDGTCDPNIGEDCSTCPADCPSGEPVLPGCGNGFCEPGLGEDCLSCAADCRGRQNGKPSNRFCCGDGDGQNPVDCSDARCTSGGFECSDSLPGGFCCGDSVCDGGAECDACDIDCSGDPVCDVGVACVPGTGEGQKGDSCTADDDCASCKCKGGQNKTCK
jgi:hypothetical protein